MATLNCISTDIIRQIISWVITYPFSIIEQWENELPLLAISHVWRSVTKEYFYRWAIVAINNDKAQECAHIKMRSNIGLIRDNGSCRMIRKLMVYIHPSEFSNPLLLTDMLGLNALKENASSTCIAAAFAKLLPNVNSLILKPNGYENNWHSLLANLIDQYGKQITELEYLGIDYISKQCTVLNLTKLNMDFRYPTGELNPIFNPRPLKEMDMTFDKLNCECNYFLADNLAQTVLFENLKELTIMRGSYPIGKHDGEFQLLRRSDGLMLEFPKLKVLSLYYVSLGAGDTACLINSSLERLNFTGSMTDVLQICQGNIQSLHTLSLSFNLDECVGSIRDNVEWSNALFCKTRGPKVVKCHIRMSRRCLDFSTINWPYLTHLDIWTDSDAVELLKAVHAMPRLIELRIQSYPDGYDMADAVTFSLSDVGNYCPKDFTLDIDYPSCMDQNPQPMDEDMAILQRLRQDIPRIKSITFH